MMKNIMIYVWTLLACGFAACSGNDDIDYVKPWNDEYVLPQGKSDADGRIVDYYNRYGSYILYEYDTTDFVYELCSSHNYNFKLPNPIYVGAMLDLLEEIWFDFYPDEFQKTYMPLKVMLAEMLSYKDPDFYFEYFILSEPSCVAIGYCSDTLQKITPATKLEFKNELQENLWNIYLNKLEFPEEFFAVSDYSSAADADPGSDKYARKRGFVANKGSEWCTSTDWQTGLLDKQKDLKSYVVSMVTRTSGEWTSDLQYELVKKKYDILRNWIQEKYGFDIQKSGTRFTSKVRVCQPKTVGKHY